MNFSFCLKSKGSDVTLMYEIILSEVGRREPEVTLKTILPKICGS